MFRISVLILCLFPSWAVHTSHGMPSRSLPCVNGVCHEGKSGFEADPIQNHWAMEQQTGYLKDQPNAEEVEFSYQGLALKDQTPEYTQMYDDVQVINDVAEDYRLYFENDEDAEGGDVNNGLNLRKVGKTLVFCMRHLPYTPKDVSDHVKKIWSIDTSDLSNTYVYMLMYTKFAHIGVLILLSVLFSHMLLLFGMYLASLTITSKNCSSNLQPFISYLHKPMGRSILGIFMKLIGGQEKENMARMQIMKSSQKTDGAKRAIMHRYYNSAFGSSV